MHDKTLTCLGRPPVCQRLPHVDQRGARPSNLLVTPQSGRPLPSPTFCKNNATVVKHVLSHCTTNKNGPWSSLHMRCRKVGLSSALISELHQLHASGHLDAEMLSAPMLRPNSNRAEANCSTASSCLPIKSKPESFGQRMMHVGASVVPVQVQAGGSCQQCHAAWQSSRRRLVLLSSNLQAPASSASAIETSGIAALSSMALSNIGSASSY